MSKRKKNKNKWYPRGFVMVPNNVITGILPKLSRTTIPIYLLLKSKKTTGSKEDYYPEDRCETLILTYKEIRAVFGFSPATINKAFQELSKFGLIDIPQKGEFGSLRKKTCYFLSSRWREEEIREQKNYPMYFKNFGGHIGQNAPEAPPISTPGPNTQDDHADTEKSSQPETPQPVKPRFLPRRPLIPST